jgi:hypothetical protein
MWLLTAAYILQGMYLTLTVCKCEAVNQTAYFLVATAVIMIACICGSAFLAFISHL